MTSVSSVVKNTVRNTLIKKARFCGLGCLAGGLGFEPRLAESESAVLPLDDPPSITDTRYKWQDTSGKIQVKAFYS